MTTLFGPGMPETTRLSSSGFVGTWSSMRTSPWGEITAIWHHSV